MELGVFSLSDIYPGSGDTAASRIDDIVGYGVLAERHGLDVFGIGEHHSRQLAVSSPAVVHAAIAPSTNRITLTTTATVLSVLDPVRVFQDFATLDLRLRLRHEQRVTWKGHSAHRWKTPSPTHGPSVTCRCGSPSAEPPPAPHGQGASAMPMALGLIGGSHAEITGMSSLIKESGLDWTILPFIRPTNAPKKNKVRAGFFGTDKIGFATTRADIAAFTAQQVDDDTYIGRTPAISN